MKKSVKKVDAKKVAKVEVMKVVEQALKDAGYMVMDGALFGMTAGTMVIRGEKVDVQIKPITPKAGLDQYAELEDEDEVEDAVADVAPTV